MCGRYVRRSDKQKIVEYFHASPQPAELPLPGEDYNVAPTPVQPIIRQSRESGELEMVLAHWGLVPFFTKELTDIKGLSTIKRAGGIDHQSAEMAPTDEETPLHRVCERIFRVVERLPPDLLRPLESDEMEMFEANLKVGPKQGTGTDAKGRCG